MSASELLEAGKIFGSILGVWFALVGWKLVPLIRAREPRRALPASDEWNRAPALQTATPLVRNATRG
jgi:hypothetical protein